MLAISTENRITTFRIARPKARNAVNPKTATALFQAFLDFDNDTGSDIAILTGDTTAFCAGFDLKAAAAGMTKAWLAQHAIPKTWSNPATQPLPSPMGPARLLLSKPVIAAIEGPAVAGGMELALWCDIRIMARSANFGVFCRRWGVPLIDGGTVRLPRIIGAGRASDLILTGRAVDAQEALAIGLATRICDDGDALKTACIYAAELQRFPQDCLNADRLSARLSGKKLAKALRHEWQTASGTLGEVAAGAVRFAAGKGRSGDFGDI